MLRFRSCWSDFGGHRLYTLTLSRNQQTRTIGAQRLSPVRMTDHTCKSIYICVKSLFPLLHGCETHISPPSANVNLNGYVIRGFEALRLFDSVILISFSAVTGLHGRHSWDKSPCCRWW